MPLKKYQANQSLLPMSQPLNCGAVRYLYNGEFIFAGANIAFKATFLCSLALVDNNDNEIFNNQINANDEFTIATPDGIKSMRIYVRDAIVNGYCMINEGTTPLPYFQWNDIPYRRYETATDAVTNLPVEIFTDGQPVSSYTLKGNTSVSGTPSPQNPVTVDGVGEETANLFDYNQTTSIIDNSYINQSGTIVSDSQYYLSYPITVETDTVYTWRFNEDTHSYHNSPTVGFYDNSDNLISVANHAGAVRYFSFTTPSNCAYIRASVFKAYKSEAMLNVGSEPLNFEPYGYKISILKGLTPLTPIYVSQPLMYLENGDNKDELSSSGNVTYKIAKYICKGNNEESWSLYDTSNVHQFYSTGLNLSGVSTGNNNPVASCLSNIAPYGAIASTRANYDFGVYLVSDGTNLAFQMRGASTQIPDVTAWKQFLADQYAAGTPVTVYYVLATPTTESVTVPTITTTGGEVTLDVDTTIKPSELDLTYHGWHEHEPLKRENGSWN